ncbi:MAG TPA: GNAT family protein [Acidimicrobiales bacterium]
MEPSDLPIVHALVNSSPMNATWRFRGRFVPSFDIERIVAEAALTCLGFAGGSTPVGLYQVFDHQPLDRHAQVSVLASADSRLLGYGAEGALLFVGLAFAQLDLRKLYFLLSDASDSQVGATLARFTSEEGRMRQHVLLDGAWQDVVIRAMYRPDYVRMISEPQFRGCFPIDLVRE